MMHLADFDELIISNRIWTESTQIRERLQKVTEHMENVFQTYLRSEFETIEEYNASAGEVAEPYHFVVIAGFPNAFSEESARYLRSILTSGPRCGVHTLITWSPDQAVPRTFDINDLLQSCVRFRVEKGQLRPLTSSQMKIEFEPLSPPDANEFVSIVRAVGEQSKDARRVEVSFTRISRERKTSGVIQRPMALILQSVEPVQQDCSTCDWAAEPASMYSSPEKPGPANQRFSIS